MAELHPEDLEHMSPAEERAFWTAFERTLANDDGAAAQAHLAAGRPIHYYDDRYPDHYIQEWPDGRRDLITVDDEGRITVTGSL